MVHHSTSWKTAAAESLLAKSCSKIPTFARYCLDILTGNVAAGRLVFLAIERTLNDLQNSQGPKGSTEFYFDQAAAARAIAFFQKFLFLAEGDNAGQPFKLQPWQQFIIGSLFGWKSADGFRRFRTAYIEIGKGNGKSPVAAGIGLFGLIADKENAAEIYSAAVVKDQAKILFRDAENMRDASPFLKAKIARHVNNLSVTSTASFFRPISSEKRGLDGKRPHIVLVDELHEHPSPVVVDKMRAGTKGRRQALIFEITNSGYDRETVCFYHHDYSRQLLEGTLQNNSWFAYVCQLDACEDCRKQGREQPACDNCDSWLDEEAWIKANPNLGVSIQLKYLREQVTEAMAMPAKENIVKRLNFCLWTQSETRAISADQWRLCAGTGGEDPVAWRRQKLESVKGTVWYGALDLASTTDIAAAAFFIPKQPAVPKPVLIPFFYAPAEAVQQKVMKDRIPFDLWVKQGFIFETPGQVIDYDFIREHLKGLRADYDLREIAFDPWNAQQLVTQLENDEFTMVKHQQTIGQLTDPTKHFLKMITGAEFEHGNNPVLAWMADNLVVKSDASGNLRPLKPGNPNSPKKIDGIVATIMADGRMTANPEIDEKPEVFFI
jgi:phage terminase large subunit-like protein